MAVTAENIPFRPHSERRFKTLRAVTALVLREMSTTYGRSPGGYIWAVLEPVAGIALLTFVFSLAFRQPPVGVNFSLFYATGLVPFMAYLSTSQKVAQSISFSKRLLFYQGVTYVDALAARFMVSAVTQIMVLYILMSGILIGFETHAILNVPAIALSFFMALALGLGIGVLNCFLNSMFPVWAQIWTVLNRPMFFISCIFFIFDTIPQPYRDYLWYNPLIHIVGQMRHGFYPTYDAVYVSPLYVFSVSLICLFFGLLLLRRYHREILNF